MGEQAKQGTMGMEGGSRVTSPSAALTRYRPASSLASASSPCRLASASARAACAGIKGVGATTMVGLVTQKFQ